MGLYPKRKRVTLCICSTEWPTEYFCRHEDGNKQVIKMKLRLMKSIMPLSVITILAALALVGCNQSSPSNSTETPASNSRMSDANGMMGGTTNMTGTNSMPNMDMSATNKTTGSANDATR